MNDKEYELLEYVFQLAYSSAYSEEIKEISDLENKIIKKLESEDKAIEYIETQWKKESYYDDIDNCLKQMLITEYDKDDLLEILKGDSNE